jgi:hypothetical protein
MYVEVVANKGNWQLNGKFGEDLANQNKGKGRSIDLVSRQME